MARGKFIVFEGGEGSGKSVLIERLKKELPDVVYTQDPGGTPLGLHVRNFLMSDKSAYIDARAELLLFLAARTELIAKVIAPALASGKHVISNRFSLSSIAYQVYGRERPELLSFVQDITRVIHGHCVPDATVLLDVTPEVGIERVRARTEEATRFDNEDIAFHARVREGFKKHVGDWGKPFIIDSDKPLEEVWTNVLAAVQSVI